MSGRVSRRAVLRGAGVALALPWLESWASKAGAQAALPPKRFVAIFLPMGAPEFWKPPAAGVGDNWQLSSILEPLSALKSKVTVVSGLENGSAFNANGSATVEPSHARMTGGWLTCADAEVITKKLGVLDANGISLDQVMATHPAFAGKTGLPSLQVGLSTIHSYCDNRSCSLSRSVSWSSETKPMGKLVDPLAVFNKLLGVGPGTAPSGALRDSRKSVLDAVLESSAAVRARVSASDKVRLDEFSDAIRAVEIRVVDQAGNVCQSQPNRPTIATVTEDGLKRNTPTYSRAVHADLMNELLALALQCGQTSLASYMLDDERSEFVFDFLPKRQFSPVASVQVAGTCPEWHGGGQSGAVDDFATIVHWHVGKVAEFCQRLAHMREGDGSVLDNSVIFMGSCMHGQDHQANDLPSLIVGGGGGALKTNQYLALNNRPLRDFYFTLMNGVFAMNATSFGVNATGAPIAMIPQMLA